MCATRGARNTSSSHHKYIEKVCVRINGIAHQNQQHDHIILTDSSEVLEFCDPRVQQIKSTLEEIFDIEILHHSLNFYAKKKGQDDQTNDQHQD